MTKSVKVGDYFDSDDNGLWSWYLSHIRSGDFEEFSRNELKVTLLKRFLNAHFGTVSSGHVKQNTKILFVSIPDKVHRDLTLLENFLRDYFHLEHLEHIQITKLTHSRTYNHENHYILIDKLNNFGDPEFLQFASSKWQPQSHKVSDRASSIDLEHKICGTVTEHSGSTSRSSSSDNVASVGYEYRRQPQSVEVNSIQSESTTEQPEIDDDENESIVLDFPHSLLRKQIEEKKLAALKEQQQRLAQRVPGNNFAMSKSSNIYSPPISENVSINSFEDSMRDGADSITDRGSYSGQPISLTLTRNEEVVTQEDKISDLSSISESMASLESATSFDEECDLDNGSESSDYSVLSILPSISISDALGHFRLVLQSTLLQDPETKEIFTAIRQSNNQPTVADVEDDWLLYDSHFSMNNLQMLSLQELLDANRSFPKIIFYSMIVISDEQEELLDMSNARNGLKFGSQMTLQDEASFAPAVPKVTSNVSMSNEPQQFYANMDDADTSLSEQSGPQLYAPTRVQSNATTAHRSIRTINSIGDWAFSHNNDAKNYQVNHGDGKDETTEANIHIDAGHQGIQWLSPNKPSRNGLSKVSTFGSMNTVERSKSTPLPALGSLNGMDGEGKHWKDKITTFRKKKTHKRHGNGKDCVIM